MSQIKENYKRISENIARAALESGRVPQDVILVGATKTKPPELINEAIEAGLRYIGENRAQEVTEKYEAIIRPKDFHEHFIGRLQTNKIKYIYDKVDMIESIDRMTLAVELSRFLERRERDMDILLEINIASEASKGGFMLGELDESISRIATLPHLKIRGLMAVPPVSEGDGSAYLWFDRMYKLFVDIKGKKYDNVNMDFLSMGMSHDYEKAIAAGANIVRVGSALFGARDYLPALKK